MSFLFKLNLCAGCPAKFVMLQTDTNFRTLTGQWQTRTDRPDARGGSYLAANAGVCCSCVNVYECVHPCAGVCVCASGKHSASVCAIFHVHVHVSVRACGCDELANVNVRAHVRVWVHVRAFY